MAVTATKSITIKNDVHTIYKMWADFEQFPSFMKSIKSVKKLDETLSHWVAEGPMGKDIEWNAETTLMEEDKQIAWNTKDHEGDIKTSGQVTFTELSPLETQVTVTMKLELKTALGGSIVEGLGKLDGHVTETLRSFKAQAELETHTANNV